MKKMFKLFLTVTMVIACAGMWGCGNDYTHVGNRYEGMITAVVDDSLALVRNSREYDECYETFMGNENCERSGINDGLFLVNYREKKTPLWGDTIDGDLSIVEGFFRDSSVLYSNAKNEFGFWKIGEKPRVVRKWKCESPCECNQAKYGRPWEKGNILLKMVQQNGCPYAVLDTATGVVKKLEFKGEFAWLDGCDDITYIDGDVVCLKRFDNAMGAVSLLNQKGVIDSLENTKNF